MTHKKLEAWKSSMSLTVDIYNRGCGKIQKMTVF